jgi:hypothetical protein
MINLSATVFLISIPISFARNLHMLESLVVVHKRMSYNSEVHQKERERGEYTYKSKHNHTMPERRSQERTLT